MDVATVMGLLNGAKELAEFARMDMGDPSDNRQAREAKSIIEALRLIYFSPRGVILLLEEIAAGRQPTTESVEFILPSFNDAEPFVLRALHVLNPDVSHRDRKITLKAQKILREIAWGKGGIREKVQELLNYSLTHNKPISSEDAKALIGEIAALNTAIEEAEEALVAWSRQK